jgi:general secretion pathway protein D
MNNSATGGLNSGATGARSSFQNNLQRIVNNAAGAGQFQLFGQTKIIADERTNSLLVFANDDDMKMIKDIIKKLDIVLPQVLIDAIIMEINLTGTQSTGVSYLVQRQNAGSFAGAGGINNLSSAASGFLTGNTSSSNGTSSVAGTGSTLANLPGGFSYFAKFGNDLNVVLEAVAGDSRVNVLSRPRIQTSHAVPADLFIGNTVPYVTGTYNYGYASGPSSQYTQLEVGIHLQVLPLINLDGLVEMDIQADVEQLGPGVAIAGVGSVPTTTKRQAGAKVAVLDGETVILGGFISDSRTTSDSGIPWLKDIPWLGNMFKSRSTENLRTELIMLMRPTVLKTPEIASQVATIERNKLAGVKEAELEIRQEEADRNAELEAKMATDAARRAKEAARKKKQSDTIYTNTPSLKSIPPVEDEP